MIFTLDARPVFPPPHQSEPDGLLAVGGDLREARLLEAYRCGIFPWYSSGGPILWWSPPERAVFLPGDEHLPSRTKRKLRSAPFEIRVDTAFPEVMRNCATVGRSGGPGTWITDGMLAAYAALHGSGYAHSFEAWQGGALVGGLYGISLGAAFFGESMFSKVDDASRAAFAALCAWCWSRGFHFIDGQVPNENLEKLGARVMDREEFLARLRRALELPTRRGPWTA
ncbi:MAG: leucyl/phenylalanyl-tRNA--protein transferase [Holophagaceae bacterium]|nr:leucyl/phenylalanyl-tRNA--protein transferase [Holophagaceae bacterium]